METNDYRQFSFLNQNRRLSKKHVEKLKNSMRENGFIAAFPIMVDFRKNVIDGQHRFCAAKELNIPILYEVVDVKDVNSVMQAVNNTSAPWGHYQWLHHYCTLGISDYIKLNNLVNEYKGITMTNIRILTGESEKAHDFKNGNFKLKHDAEYYLLEYDFFKKNIGFSLEKAFAHALISVIKSGEENIQKVKDNVFGIIKCADSDQYKRQFESIINKRKKYKIKLK